MRKILVKTMLFLAAVTICILSSGQSQVKTAHAEEQGQWYICSAVRSGNIVTKRVCAASHQWASIKCSSLCLKNGVVIDRNCTSTITNTPTHESCVP